MRVVFDCNVLISALLSINSISGLALLKAKSSSYTILLSNEVLTELIDVLMRAKFDKYVSREIRLLFLQEFESLSTKITPNRKIEICRDPKDDKYLELAVSGGANLIITGDADLLILNPFENISIFSPNQFLNQVDPFAHNKT